LKNAPVVPHASGAKAKVSAARAAAFHILLEMGRSASAHSDDLLQSAAVNALSAQDRNLCMALTMGVLRWQLLLDAVIVPLLTHKTKLDEPVRVALRMGAFQLMMMDRIPAHAAISDSVELTKRAGHRFASGLVNAVLRKLAVTAQKGAEKPEMDAVLAHPGWMVERWRSFYDDETAQAICAWDQQQPAATLRVPTAEAEAELIAKGTILAPGNFLAKARQVLSVDVAHALRLQDEGSQLVAELPGGTKPVASSLDCCAAPGGKTAILAERFPESRVVACDVSTVRVQRMQEFFSTSPLTTRIECRVADALEISGAEQFDLVLCDVPCSGTGTLARNPEIKQRLQPEDLVRQRERQVAILRSALKAVAAGGELVYSTCSLEPEENEQVVEAVLAGVSGFATVPVRERLEQLRVSGTLRGELPISSLVRGDFLRTTPGLVPSDGFFAAVIRRG
jgi:16S rRNA (cytosine967-C5)-methyltransferase